MPKLRNKITGEIIEIPDQPGMQRIGPANTMRPLQEQGAQLGNQRTAQQIQATDQRMASDAELLPLRKQLMAAQIAAAAAKQNPKSDPKMKSRLANLKALEAQIARVGQLYQQGPGATSGLSGLLDYLPTNQNKQFDAAGAGLGEMGLAAFRVPGVGSQSDAELRAFIEANRPSASDRDPQIEEKLRNLQTRLGANYQSLGVPFRPQQFKKKKATKPADDGWSIVEDK